MGFTTYNRVYKVVHDMYLLEEKQTERCDIILLHEHHGVRRMCTKLKVIYELKLNKNPVYSHFSKRTFCAFMNGSYSQGEPSCLHFPNETLDMYYNSVLVYYSRTRKKSVSTQVEPQNNVKIAKKLSAPESILATKHSVRCTHSYSSWVLKFFLVQRQYFGAKIQLGIAHQVHKLCQQFVNLLSKLLFTLITIVKRIDCVLSC